MKPRSVCLVLVTLGSLAAAGCRDRGVDRDRPGTVAQPDREDRSGTTNLTGAAWIANGPAVDRIVASRCARELTCSNVGPDKHFTTSDACVFEVRKRMEGELSNNECPMGIDGRELDDCLDAIRKESCSNAIETIGRIAACRTSKLCMRGETPHP